MKERTNYEKITATPKTMAEFIYELMGIEFGENEVCTRIIGGKMIIIRRIEEWLNAPIDRVCSICKTNLDESDLFKVNDKYYCVKCYRGNQSKILNQK